METDRPQASRSPRRSSRLASLENAQPESSPKATRKRSLESSGSNEGLQSSSKAARSEVDGGADGVADDDDAAARSSEGARDADVAGAGARDEAPAPARSPPRKKRAGGMPAWSSTFSVAGQQEFARLQAHFRDEIDTHRLTIKDVDGTLSVG